MINYVYLDDESTTEVRATIKSVTFDNKNFKIDLKHPMRYNEQIKKIKEWQTLHVIDGLILDLRLDQFPEDNDTGEHGQQADYRAATLAQEIRTRATEGEIEDLPIVLWSTDGKLAESYYRDNTSHDLFDLKTVKSSLEDRENANAVSLKLESLVEGYRKIDEEIKRDNFDVFKLLSVGDEIDIIDDRVVSSIDMMSGTLPVHEYARFILRQLLETQGVLIDKRVLASRLGVDLALSGHFDALIEEHFAEASYKGVFSKGWKCWWSALVDRTWIEFEEGLKPLRSTTADERVAVLKQKFGYTDLVVASPLVGSKESSFWTICVATLRPLDPRDGFLVDKQPKFPWQDRLYVSLEAIIEGDANEKNIMVDALELNRLEKAKNRLRNGE